MSRESKRVVVVGDWLVDDHWVVAEARSPTASRVGKVLFRSLQGTVGSATSLCGAGRTASILAGATWESPKESASPHIAKRSPKERSDHPFQVAGIGTWHVRDQEYMQTLLAAYREDDWKFTSVFQRSPHNSQPADGLTLFNLATLMSPQEVVGTTSTIRVYQRCEQDTQLRERIDFELRAPYRTGETAWLPKDLKISAKKPLINFCSSPVDAVIVKDLGKGTVSTNLIQLLAKRLPSAPWFISSKSWNPPWLQKVPKGQLRLLVIPEMASRDAVRRERVLAWTTPWGALTRDALHRLDMMFTGPPDERNDEAKLSAFWADDAAILVSFDDLKVHLLLNKRPDGYLLSARIDESSRREFTPGLPFSSVLQPALVASILHGANWHDALEKALRFTSLWRRKEAERIYNPADWDSREYRLAVLSRAGPVEGVRLEKPRSSVKELEDWTAAMNGDGRGIVAGDQGGIQLWRATSDLEDYVCCANQWRTAIHRILRGIREFLNSGAKYHSGCVLVAPPGSGKSFLIKCIASRANIRMLEPFNITQLPDHNEIHKQIFDKIHEDQQKAPDVPLLVFVDEINAGLDQQTAAYDAFLEPLQDGSYVSDRRRRKLSPCYWIFVSTRLPKTETDGKWSDFQSRLPDGVISLSTERDEPAPHVTTTAKDAQELGTELDALKLENVYLGLRTIRSANPWITHVTRAALDALFNLRVVTRSQDGQNFSQRAIDNRTLIAHLRALYVAGTLLRHEHLGEKWLKEWSDQVENVDQEKDRAPVRVWAVPGEVP
jgi:hypothetical protein